MAQGSPENTSTSAGGGHNNPRGDPVVDEPITDDIDEDTINDDSWSSTSTRHPLTRMDDAILRQPGTPGSAIDPQRASTPRRTGLTPSPAARPHTTTPPAAENAPGFTPPPATRRNPFNSPLRMPPRRRTPPVAAATNPFDTPHHQRDSPSSSDNIFLSSGRRCSRAEARQQVDPPSSDSIRAVAHARLEFSPPLRQVSAGRAVSFGFQLSAPPPPRRPDQVLTESRCRDRAGDTRVDRPSVSSPHDGRDASRSTTAMEATSRSSNRNTANTTAPTSRQTMNVAAARHSLAGRGIASPYTDSFTAAAAAFSSPNLKNPFSSPNRDRTASTEAMKDFDLDGKKKGPFGSLRQKASRVFSKGNDTGSGSKSASGDRTPLRALFGGGKAKNEGAGTEMKTFLGGGGLALGDRAPSIAGGPSPGLPSGGLTPKMTHGMGSRSPNVNKPLPPPPPMNSHEESDGEGRR